MNFRSYAVVLALVLAAAPAYGQASNAAGRIRVASGSAFIVRAGELVPAKTDSRAAASSIVPEGFETVARPTVPVSESGSSTVTT